MSDRIYRFRGFELRAADSELRTADARIPLQEKPLLLLLVLVENPQKIVTREQLRERMWPSDTFVGYEQGINVAVKKVRDALKDSADNPQFIETVAKKGYRFLPSVEVEEKEAPLSSFRPEINAGTRTAEPVYSKIAKRGQWRGWVYAVLVGVVVMVVWYGLPKIRRSTAPMAHYHGIAVLPLRDLSPDRQQEYLADGITEELITKLAQTLDLRVISLTSIMRYKQSTEPVGQIGRELGVDAIIEGSVARSGNKVRVTIQLIDPQKDLHLWAQDYDRNLEDVLETEADVARAVAARVQGALARNNGSTSVGETVDPQVYEFCLMGRYYWNQRTSEGLRRAIELYQMAAARAPTYAPAYVGLANAYALLPSYATVEVHDNLAKSAAAARRALQLDDTQAEAHANLAFIALSDQSLNWTEIEREFKRALELNPNSATTHHWYSFYLVFVDRLDEAIAEMEEARRLDPLSAVVNADEGQLLYSAGRFQDAVRRLQQAVELEPNFGQPHATLALVQILSDRRSEAIQEAETALHLDPNNQRTIGEVGYVYAMVGRVKKAEELLTKLQNASRKQQGYGLFPAFVLIGLGRRAEALDVLEKTFDTKSGTGPYGLSQWHIFDPLNSDSRYQKLQARLKQMRLDRSPVM